MILYFDGLIFAVVECLAKIGLNLNDTGNAKRMWRMQKQIIFNVSVVSTVWKQIKRERNNPMETMCPPHSLGIRVDLASHNVMGKKDWEKGWPYALVTNSHYMYRQSPIFFIFNYVTTKSNNKC